MDDREQTRRELRELVELAKTPTPPDSSGYVDLSAFSSTDPKWVEHALARARGEAAPAAAAPRKALPSEAESVRPVALSEPTHETARVAKKRRPSILAILMATAYAVALSVLGFTILKRFQPPPPRLKAAAAVAAPVAAPVDIPPPVTPPATVTATPQSPAPAATTASAPSPRAAPPPVAPKKAPAPATRPHPPMRSAPPAPKSNGGDPLLNAIQQSLH